MTSFNFPSSFFYSPIKKRILGKAIPTFELTNNVEVSRLSTFDKL